MFSQPHLLLFSATKFLLSCSNSCVPYFFLSSCTQRRSSDHSTLATAAGRIDRLISSLDPDAARGRRLSSLLTSSSVLDRATTKGSSGIRQDTDTTSSSDYHLPPRPACSCRPYRTWGSSLYQTSVGSKRLLADGSRSTRASVQRYSSANNIIARELAVALCCYLSQFFLFPDYTIPHSLPVFSCIVFDMFSAAARSRVLSSPLLRPRLTSAQTPRVCT